jgi:hypothetical protein
LCSGQLPMLGTWFIELDDVAARAKYGRGELLGSGSRGLSRPMLMIVGEWAINVSKKRRLICNLGGGGALGPVIHKRGTGPPTVNRNCRLKWVVKVWSEQERVLTTT